MTNNLRYFLCLLVGVLLTTAAFTMRDCTQRLNTIEAKVDWLVGYISTGVHQ